MVAIAGAKGRCGKSTVTLGLAAAFARADTPALAIDADRQLPNLHVMADLDHEPTVANLSRRPTFERSHSNTLVRRTSVSSPRRRRPRRPSSVSETAISQSDVLISYRLTAEADLAALNAAQPTYVNESLDERLPSEPGQVVVIDDATETIHAAQIRSRNTPHGGGSSSAREIADLE